MVCVALQPASEVIVAAARAGPFVGRAINPKAFLTVSEVQVMAVFAPPIPGLHRLDVPTPLHATTANQYKAHVGRHAPIADPSTLTQPLREHVVLQTLLVALALLHTITGHHLNLLLGPARPRLLGPA